MIIRGFSEQTGFNCSQCYLKCCATEYDLPLLPQESSRICEKYEFSSYFIRPSKRFHWLIRGDSCPFFTFQGLCYLHNSNLKPLSCKIYPLIFWRIDQNRTLVWINPCRGTSFNWSSSSQYQILNQYIQNLYELIYDKFTNYWGEQIDRKNPYSHIHKNRIDQEINFFKKNDKKSLLVEFKNLVNSNQVGELINIIYEKKTENQEQNGVNTVINAVNYWMCWSPVGLQLSFYNSKLIFLIASLWIKSYFKSIFHKNQDFPRSDRSNQQIGSLLSTAILPSFWKYVEKRTDIHLLKLFSKLAKEVLLGNLPQESLTTF